MDQKSGKPSQKRRAILQGSLAAPVVLTVSSPVTAQVTTLGRCLRNQLDQPDPAFFAASEDRWMRVQVPIVQLKNGSDVGWYFIDNILGDYVSVQTGRAMGWVGPTGATLPERVA